MGQALRKVPAAELVRVKNVTSADAKSYSTSRGARLVDPVSGRHSTFSVNHRGSIPGCAAFAEIFRRCRLRRVRRNIRRGGGLTIGMGSAESYCPSYSWPLRHDRLDSTPRA